MSLPTISVVGNLKNIELKYTQSGKAVCGFQVECADKNSKGEWTNLYLKGECWEKSAEFVNQYFSNGSVAIVTGKLYTNVYENKEGKKVYENKLLFPNVSFCPKDKADNQQGQQQAYQPQQQQQPQTVYQNNNEQQVSQNQYQQTQQGYQQPQQSELPSSNRN